MIWEGLLPCRILCSQITSAVLSAYVYNQLINIMNMSIYLLFFVIYGMEPHFVLPHTYTHTYKNRVEFLFSFFVRLYIFSSTCAYSSHSFSPRNVRFYEFYSLNLHKNRQIRFNSLPNAFFIFSFHFNFV